jgi:chromosome segregation ATPase
MANIKAVAANGSALHGRDSKNSQPSELDIALPAMDALGEELSRLAAINADLVGRLRGAAAAQVEPGEVNFLRQENSNLRAKVAEMRAKIAELEQMLISSDDEDTWSERQREYEALLEEKSEVIRSLYLKLQEHQEGPKRSPDEPPPKEEELLKIKDELDEQRRQLQVDEESLMGQMRQMELTLSRDRAELARQRQDVQRMLGELNREIEQAGRDPGLRERLNSLRRGSDAPKKEAVAVAAPDAAKPSSGLFRRLFG